MLTIMLLIHTLQKHYFFYRQENINEDVDKGTLRDTNFIEHCEALS